MTAVRPRIAILTLSLSVLGGGAAPPSPALTAGPQPAAAAVHSSRVLDRVVKVFDFDETARGNFEPTPMDWSPVVLPGFPSFLRAAFDRGLGRTSPPSLRLPLEGGSVATRYVARDMPAHPQSEYRIVGWIRPEGLRHAKAYLGGFLLDRTLTPIPSSERFSEPVDSSDGDRTWRRVVVDLPAGETEARWIGVAAWVLQPEARGDVEAVARPIARQDVTGGALFDDIAIVRLPVGRFETLPPGGLLNDDASCQVSAVVSDIDVSDLEARLIATNPAGQTVWSQPVVPSTQPVAGVEISLSSLPPGPHRLELEVRSPDGPHIRLHRRVLRVPGSLAEAGGRRCGFLGVNLTVDDHQAPTATLSHMIDWLGVGAMKLPVWSDAWSGDDLLASRPPFNELVRAMRSRCRLIVGSLESVPTRLGARFARERRSIRDVLAAPSERWLPYLAFPVARYGSAIDAWQVGGDGDTAEFEVGPQLLAVDNLRPHIDDLALHARLTTRWPLRVEFDPASASSADAMCVDADDRISPAYLADQLAAHTGAGRQSLWVHASTPFDGGPGAIAEWVKRIVTARQAGAEQVFVDAPWRLSEDGTTPELTPEAIAIKTLTTYLADTSVSGRMPLGDGVTAYLFRGVDDTDGTLVVWCDSAHETGRTIEGVFGERPRRIDLRGEIAALPPASNGHALPLTSEPVLIHPVSSWLVTLRTGIGFDRGDIEAGDEHAEVELVIPNRTERSLAGTVAINPPTGWRMDPRRFEFAVEPGEEVRRKVSVRLPRNAAAGRYDVPLSVEVRTDRAYALSITAAIEVRLGGIDVHVMTHRRGDTLVIQQRITNRDVAPVTLKSVLMSPKHPRDPRIIPALAPGETIVREYVVDGVASLAGRAIRLTLSRSDSPIAHNHVISLDSDDSTGGR